MTEHKEWVLIEEFTTPVIDSGNGEKNRWEGYITQGLPYPNFVNDEGEEGWFHKPVCDFHKTSETRSWPLMLKGYHRG